MKRNQYDTHKSSENLDANELVASGGFGRSIGYDRDGVTLSHAPVSHAATDRVWFRLEEQLLAPRGASSRKLVFTWGAAVSLATFVAGVWVGQGTLQKSSVASAPAYAEPSRAAGPVSLSAVEERTKSRAISETGAPKKLPGRLQRRSARPARARSGEIAAGGVGGSEAELLAPLPVSSGVTEEPIAPASAPSVAPMAVPKWQKLANGGEYDAALFILSQVGGFEAVLQRSNAEQLMLLVDVTRATGQPQRAIAALRRLVSEYPSAPVAPLATWSLGNLLEKTGDQEGAAAAFEVYRSLSPDGDFAEDALVRQLRGAIDQGKVTLARKLAAQYDATFPDGQRSEDIKTWMATVARGAAGSADAGAPLVVEEEAEDAFLRDEPSDVDTAL